MAASKGIAYNNNNWLIIVAITFFVFALSVFCLLLTGDNEPYSALWFSAATLMAGLFILPLRYWPASVFCCILALMAAHNLSAIVPADNWLVCLVLLEAAAAAWLLKKALNTQDPLDGIIAWLKFFLLGVLLFPLIGALTAAHLLAIPHAGISAFIVHWYSAQGVAVMALTPVGILCRRQALSQLLKQQSWIEALLLAALTLLVGFLAMKFSNFPFAIILLPLLLAALRLPRFEAFCLYLLVTPILFVYFNSGLIHLNVRRMPEPELLPPMRFLIMLIPVHAMTMMMYAFRVERNNILQSETRFRNAMEYSAIGMALVSLEGTWLQVNKSLCRFLQYSPRQMEQLSFQEITHPDDLTTDLKQLSDLVSGNIDSYTLEKRYIRNDGETVWALLAVSLVRDQDGIPLYFISQIEDINEFKQSELLNQRLMERITLANEAGGMGIWEWDITHDTLSWDKRMEEIYALPPERMASYDYWLSCIIPEDRERILQLFNTAMGERKPFTFEFRIQHPELGLRYLRIYANVLANNDSQGMRMLGINFDVTGEARLSEALHEEKERLHITLSSIGDAVISVDKEMCIIFMNPVAEKMTGWLQEDAQGKHIDSITQLTLEHDGTPLPTLLQTEIRPLAKSPALEPSVVLHSRSGQFFDIQHHCTPLKNREGAILGAVLVIKDVTESRHLMQQLSYNALHDDLTGLPNRANFAQHLDQALQTALGQKRRHALVFIDLDRFKEINDRAGHAAGDALLLELGLLMQKNIRHYDCLARLGGDEFGLILPDCTLNEAQKQVQRVIDAINGYAFHWDDKLYTIGGSAGITIISHDNFHTKEVMAQADIACYTAKHSGRGQVVVYESQLKHPDPLSQSTRASYHNRIIDMLDNDELVIMADPVAPPMHPQSVGFYQISLMAARHDNPQAGQDEFFLPEQQYQLPLSLDNWLINQVFGVYGVALAQRGMTLAIPLSLPALNDTRLVSDLLTLLALPGHLTARSVIISLNGTAFMNHYPAIAAPLKRLRQEGCRIMLDQFGDNFSAFNKLPVGTADYIKLPNRFIHSLHSSQMDEMMVAIINGHIHRLNACSVAGPANQPAVLDKLRHLEVDWAQGDTISRAMPLVTMLNNGVSAIG